MLGNSGKSHPLSENGIWSTEIMQWSRWSPLCVARVDGVKRHDCGCSRLKREWEIADIHQSVAAIRVPATQQ
jgi:hypothetical protein